MSVLTNAQHVYVYLDTSASMRGLLRDGFRAAAKIIRQECPDATIELNTFDTRLFELGSMDSKTFSALSRKKKWKLPGDGGSSAEVTHAHFRAVPSHDGRRRIIVTDDLSADGEFEDTDDTVVVKMEYEVVIPFRTRLKRFFGL